MPPAFNTLTDRARLATFGLRYHRAVEVACPTLHCSSTTEYFQTKPFCRAESPARWGGKVILRNEPKEFIENIGSGGSTQSSGAALPSHHHPTAAPLGPFLEKNCWTLNVDPDEATAAILHLAAGMLSESELNQWIEAQSSE
jgi:hypothetical protein